MKYKVYHCNSYNIHTIKTDRFKTTHMEVVFRNNATKENLPLYSFIADLISESTVNYPKKRDLVSKFEELYNTHIYATTSRVGASIFTNINADFINPEYIKDKDYLEEVIKLVFEIIKNPNANNKEFNLKQFNIIKERLRREILSISENPVKESIRESIDLMNPNTATKYRLYGTIDNLDSITPSSLYKAYEEFFKENLCDIFIIGNLDMDEVVCLINKYFDHRFIVEKDISLLIDNKTTKKVKEGSRVSNNIQANMALIYNISDMTKYEKDIVFNVFNYIFGNGGLSSKLYQEIREKNSFCYGINSYYLKYDSLLLIQISLDNANIKKARSLVDKCLKEMIKGEFLDSTLNDAKENLINALTLVNDNNMSILNNYIFMEYDNIPLMDERKELISKVTKKDIINVSKKIKLNTVFSLMGRSK